MNDFSHKNVQNKSFYRLKWNCLSVCIKNDSGINTKRKSSTGIEAKATTRWNKKAASRWGVSGDDGDYESVVRTIARKATAAETLANFWQFAFWKTLSMQKCFYFEIVKASRLFKLPLNDPSAIIRDNQCGVLFLRSGREEIIQIKHTDWI